MQPLEMDEIANYAPTYWKNMGETIEQYGIVDKKNMFIFAARPNCRQLRGVSSAKTGSRRSA